MVSFLEAKDPVLDIVGILSRFLDFALCFVSICLSYGSFLENGRILAYGMANARKSDLFGSSRRFHRRMDSYTFRKEIKRIKIPPFTAKGRYFDILPLIS